MSRLILKSENQILGQMARVVLARTGLNDLNPGSVLLTLLQAAAQEDFAQYYQMLQVIRNFNLDTTTGSDLDNRAFEYGLSRRGLLSASGRITIFREESFVKISTDFYVGFRSAIAGDTEIFVNNASAFPTSGSPQTLIIGRGTPNEEEILYTPSGSNPEDNVNYFKITLDTPLVNDHAVEETVILKQGSDIFISAGTVIRVPASGRTPEIIFTTSVDSTILAGEDRIEDVNIIASQPGTGGNIGVLAITGTTAFVNPPFAGARAENDTAFSNGQDRETDTSLRNRIKNHIQAISQSTKAGIANAIDGLVDSLTAKRVVSSNIILPDNVGLPVKIYIDDGTGFEADFLQQGFEVLIASADGGEQRLQLDNFPLVKAQIENLVQEPYDMSTNGLTLDINVGNEDETITFFTGDFVIPEAATAEEIVRVINDSATILEARTSQVGTQVVINAKVDINEGIQVVGGTANSSLNFPTMKVETLYLYKNDLLLSKDGETAFIDSGDTEPYDFSGPDQTLSVTVDGKTANVQTATIQESDFDSPAAAAVASAAEVAAIIDAQIAGATVVAMNGRVRIISNMEFSSDSKIKVNSSTAQVTLNFSTVEVVGRNKDYILNGELGVIELTDPLLINDRVTAGTGNTRAFLTASIPQNYTFAGGETLAIKVDGGATQTIIFTAGANQTAQAVANFINNTLVGATAVTRTVGADIYLEIRTNTLDLTIGSIEILGSSTSNSIFGFTTDVIVVNNLAHSAFAVAANSGPYAFAEDETLVVVLDNDTGKTFVITMDYPGIVSSGTSTTVFAASGLVTVFPLSNILVGFWVVADSGANSTSGDIESVQAASVSQATYFFKNPPPPNFDDFDVGDHVTFTDMDNAANNGSFLIDDITEINVEHAPVITRSISNPSALTPLVGDRYLINPDATLGVQPSVISRIIDNPGFSSTSSVIISNASPAVVSTSFNNGLNAGNPVVFSTTGTLPTGLVAGTTYYVISDGLTDNTFEVSATINGPAINTSSAGTGVHSFNTFGAIVPILNDRYIIGLGANDAYISNVKGRYRDSNHVDVQEIHGYRYIVNGTGLNDWAGHDNEIAEYNGIGTPGWLFITPSDEDVTLSEFDNFYYQFDMGTGTWVQNKWGGRASKIATGSGFVWTFATPVDKEVRLVTSEASARVQFDITTNTWVLNVWGGLASEIAEWNGLTWTITSPVSDDTVFVTDESQTLIRTFAATWIPLVFFVEVTNPARVEEVATAAGSGLLGQRRQISAYNNITGSITVTAPFRTIPAVTTDISVIPGTRQNVVSFFNNIKVTSLSTKAFIELAQLGQKIQISSQAEGSDGAVQVTGGRANDELQFNNTLNEGLRAYDYYIGLIKLVHSTIYGDEEDLITFPGVGAAGVKFQILPPTVVEASFSVDVTLTPSLILSSVESEIKTKIIAYVNGLGVAQPVILSAIVEHVREVQGIVDITVESPSTNIVTGENELARTKASLISVNVVV